jgi:hypothetical protein
MNRRNVLIGIGTAAAGSGAVLGSGALTSVSANRTLSITTVDDDTASTNVQLSADSSLVTNTGSGNNGQSQLEISLDNLNDDATTTLDPAFTVTNNVGDGVGVKVTSSIGGVTLETESSGQTITSFPSGSGDDHNLDDGGSVSVVVEVDTATATDASGTITVEADTSEHNS